MSYAFHFTVYILVYVDDIIITGCTTAVVQQIITKLSARLSLKDLCELNYFLGVEVLHKPNGLVLTQRKYIMNILQETHMEGSNGVPTPMSTSLTLSVVKDSRVIDQSGYHRLVGKLQYLSLTRPDISFTVNKLSQYLHCPQKHHWQAVKCLLRYLKQTASYGLYLARTKDSKPHMYSIADWAGDPSDRTSNWIHSLLWS